MTSSNSLSNMSQQPSPNNIQTADISPIPPTATASTTTTGSHYNNHHIHHYINDRGHHHSHYYINRDGSTSSSFEDDNQQEQEEYNNNNTHHQDEEEEEEYYDDEETTASYTSSDSEHHSHHHLKPLFTTSKHSSQPKASTSTSTVANNTKNNARYYVSRDEDGTNTPTKRQNSTGEEEDDDSSYTITIHTEDQPPNANIQVKIASLGTSGEEKAFLVTRETTSPTSVSAIAAHSDDIADYESGKLSSSSSIATEEGSEATVQVVTHSLRYQILGTAAAAAYFMACSTVLLFVMNFVHARVPKVEPLPDIGHDIITHLQPEFLGDIVMITMYVMLGGCLLLSGNRRWKMATRFLFAYGTLYLIRTTTISATSMPATKNHCYYNPEPIENIWWNTFIGLVTMGALNKHCGDLLFSGHTCSITLILLVFWCYHSRHVLLNLVLTLVGVTGFVFIIGTRSHYTVDVLVALYLTVFVWGVCPESWDKPLFQMKKGKNQIVNVYRKLSGFVLPSRRHIRI